MLLRTECYLGFSQDSDSQLEANLENADPELCIRLLQVPTVVNYSGVRCRLEGSDPTWMFQFLELSGLDLLLEALERFSDRGRGCSRFADPDLQLTCVNCVRAVMNSSAGIHFIVEDEGYIRKLSQALDTCNTVVKKQVFELLAALSMSSSDGYRLALDALDHYKGVKTQQHRFSVIMNEMQATDNVPYMVTLLSVINALIVGTDDLRERDKMRKEFIGLQLLDMLLKCSDKKDKDLIVQCDVFKEAKAEDEDELLRIYEDTDMGNQLEMLHLGPYHCDIWHALEALTDRDTLLAQDSQMESSEKVMQRLLMFSKGKSEAGHDDVDGHLVRKTIQTDQMDGDEDRPARSTSTPPSAFTPPPPPPPPPPQHPGGGPTRAGRRPNKKMKKLNWQNIPKISDHSMWALVQKVPPPLEPDYSSIEELFCFPAKEQKDKGAAAPVKKKSKKTFIDEKKNLNLNIFLKQFKCSNEDLVAMIQKGDRTKFDVEVLKELQKLLPDQQEIEKLKSFRGEKDNLANVDHFYMSLLSVPCYELRIECMLMCEETHSVIEMFRPKVQLVEEACQSLRDSNLLSGFCRFILDVGNFLNYESQKKNAEGFKLSSLLKLTETKANESGITLLHHILEKAEQNHPKLLELQDDIEKCEKAAGVKLGSIQSEASDSQKGPKEPSIKEIIMALLKRLEDTAKKVSNSGKDVKEQYRKVIEGSMQACRDLEEKFLEIDKKRRELAVYLCEDADHLSLEELFVTMRTFRRQFIKALKENETRLKQAERKRNKELTEEESKRPKGENREIIKRGVLPQNDHIIDDLWAGLRKGVPLSVTRPRCDSERLPSSDTGPSDMDKEGTLKEMEEEKAVPVEQEETTEEQGVVVSEEPSELKGNDTAVGKIIHDGN